MKKTFYVPIVITFCVIFLFYIKRFFLLKLYPPICNLFLFLVFSVSLFGKETVIQKFARLCGDELKEPVWIYTRRVTYLWAIFTFLNFLISVWTIFQADRIWFIYNGCISYLLIGLLFGVEYIVRVILRRRNLI